MSLTSPDARAVVAAVDRLTTQVKRLADEASTPVVGLGDALPTTPRCACGDPIELRGDPPGWIHSPGSDTPCLDPCPPAGIPVPDPDAPNRAQQAPAATEDPQRPTRRARLHNLLARADRSHLTPGEVAVLRELVDVETREADTGRAIAAGNLRHVQLLYADLQQAQARVRQLETAVRATLHLCGDQGSDVQDILRPALDDTEQPEEG